MNSPFFRAKLLTAILFQMTLSLTSSAQNILYTRAELSWFKSLEPETRSEALLIFDKASGELRGKLSLLPLIKNATLLDSIQGTSEPLELKFSGVFPSGLVPISQPEFFSAAENEKQVKMDTRYQLGDSAVNGSLTVILTMLRDKANVPPSAIEAVILPCRANFVIQLDPKDFGLHLPPLKWTQPFIVEVENGIINRQ